MKVCEQSQSYRKKPILVNAKQMDEKFYVVTLEGLMSGEKGDYLVIGIDGESYPVKNSIFKKTFQFKCNCGQYHDVGEMGKKHTKEKRRY